MSQDAPTSRLHRTPLHALHIELGGKMVPFAGYEMPVQYGTGIVAEHKQTRDAAALFDVSHMGQAVLTGTSDNPASSLLERVAPGAFRELAVGAMRYSLLLAEDGGILDDFMATRWPDDNGLERFYLVVNAARKTADFEHLRERIPEGRLQILGDRALVAVQGPRAADAMARLAPAVASLKFMTGAEISVGGAACFVSRSGYTGEDGFEVSVAADEADKLARRLLAEVEIAPAGLGARDTLRLEAGLCLYGHDIDETTSPVEANLTWAIGKRRREAGDFPGAERILRELADGPARRRVGIRSSGRVPAREGAPIKDMAGQNVGTVTSGGHGPTVGGPVAMGYVAADQAKVGTEVILEIRGKDHDAQIVGLPFVPANYFRG